MKKILPFFMAILLVLCSGCTKLSGDYMSSEDYINYLYSSDVEFVYQSGTSEVDSVVSEIESDLSQLEQAGEVSINSFTSSYVTDAESEDFDEIGKQNAVIDSDIGSGNAQQIQEADVNTKGTKPLYYSNLTNNQKRIYRFMKFAAENMTEGLFSIGAVSSGEQNRFSDITVAFRALSGDNPHIFWLPNTYIVSPDGSSVAFAYHENGYNIDYSVTKDKHQAMQKALYEVIAQLTKEANKLDSRFKKELYFHDWLCQNVTYGSDGTDDSYTAYGALVNGTAVCEGYSRAMQLLCDNVGIPCTVVYGYSNGIGHMWNIIDPGDGWYHLDVTWDDDHEYDVTRYTYFNVSDSIIKMDHVIFDAVSSDKSYISSDYFNIYLYTCNSTNYNYFEKNNLILNDDLTHSVELITKAAQSGQTVIELMYTNSNSDYVSVLNQLNLQLCDNGIFINRYSPLGSAIVLWLTFV